MLRVRASFACRQEKAGAARGGPAPDAGHGGLLATRRMRLVPVSESAWSRSRAACSGTKLDVCAQHPGRGVGQGLRLELIEQRPSTLSGPPSLPLQPFLPLPHLPDCLPADSESPPDDPGSRRTCGAGRGWRMCGAGRTDARGRECGRTGRDRAGVQGENGQTRWAGRGQGGRTPRDEIGLASSRNPQTERTGRQ